MTLQVVISKLIKIKLINNYVKSMGLINGIKYCFLRILSDILGNEIKMSI